LAAFLAQPRVDIRASAIPIYVFWCKIGLDSVPVLPLICESEEQDNMKGVRPMKTFFLGLFLLTCTFALVCLLVLIWQEIQDNRRRSYRRLYRQRKLKMKGSNK